jgi:hypothetical protein
MSSRTLIEPTCAEQERRDSVMRRILECVNENRTIKLPPFDRNIARPSDQFALVSVGLEENEYSGVLGDYHYQFEGEEDLLHLMITQKDGLALTPETGQCVASFVLRGLPTALIWLKPGRYSQHFYFGHDDLIGNLIV